MPRPDTLGWRPKHQSSLYAMDFVFLDMTSPMMVSSSGAAQGMCR